MKVFICKDCNVESSYKTRLPIRCKSCAKKHACARNKVYLQTYKRSEESIERKKVTSSNWGKLNRPRIREKEQQRAKDNPERLREKSRRWRAAHPDESRKRSRLWAQANSERNKTRSRLWREANPEKAKKSNNVNFAQYSDRRRVRNSVRYNTDPHYNLIVKSRVRIRKCLSKYLKGMSVGARTIKLLGCSAKEFKIWIERQFSEGMSWDAVLDGRIHLDHVVPIAAYGPDEIEDAFFYVNVAPMWAKDNLRKGMRMPEPWEDQ